MKMTNKLFEHMSVSRICLHVARVYIIVCCLKDERNLVLVMLFLLSSLKHLQLLFNPGVLWNACRGWCVCVGGPVRMCMFLRTVCVREKVSRRGRERPSALRASLPGVSTRHALYQRQSSERHQEIIRKRREGGGGLI